MTATEHNPAAWAVAVALAGDADWARWARGETAPPPCDCAYRSYNANRREYETEEHTSECSSSHPVPVPAPWDADTYRADCERRGVEPGPLPSLSWTGPDGFGWSVHDRYIAVGFTSGTTDLTTWTSDIDALWFSPDCVALARTFADRIVRLATAAAKAMGR